MKNKKNSGIFFHGLILLVLLGAVIYAYRGMFQTFYQQDEWLTLGWVFSDGFFGGLKTIPLILLVSGYWRLLGSMANNIMFTLFPFQIAPLAVWSIGFHAMNSMLVYLLLYKMFRRRLLATLASLFFAAGYVHSQAVSWFACVFTTLPSLTFILLSLLALYLWQDTRKYRFLWLSQLSCLVAYFFKESSLFLFFLLPVLFLRLKPKIISWKKAILLFSPIVLYGIFVIIVRLESLTHLGGNAGLFVSNSPSMMVKTVLHAILYPMISFSQMYLTPKILFKVSTIFLPFFYGWQSNVPVPQKVSEFMIPDFLSVIFSFVLFSCCMGIMWVNKSARKPLVYGLIFAFVSFLPFAVLDRSVSYLDLRYFYAGMVGGGLIFAVFVEYLAGFFLKTIRIAPVAVYAIFIAILGFYFYKNIQFVRRDIWLGEILADERVSFLGELKRTVPKLPDRPVFYISGDNPGFYAIPLLKVPLQQGVGYTLMVWFFDTGKIPKELLRQQFLWGIFDQGYKRVGNDGFGYFWDINELGKYVKSDTITREQLVGLYYDSGNRELRDITHEIRVQIYE